MVDRGDLAGATSSASSKLLHGGLRYLAMGDVGLVREAHAERRPERPGAGAAPGAAAGVRGAGRPRRAGAAVEGAGRRLAVRRAGRVSATAAAAASPTGRGGARGCRGCARDGLAGAVLYHDHQTHDGRLTLAVLQAAAAARAASWRPMWRRWGFGSRAAGWPAPSWSTALARRAGCGDGPAPSSTRPGRGWTRCGGWSRRRPAPACRLSKGAHLVLEGAGGWRAA